jgi:hypothetical protein
MDFIPPRRLGIVIGGLQLVVAMAAVVVGVYQLATAPISAWVILWVTLPLIGVPFMFLVSYRLYGLFTSRYRLDRDGFYLTWGMAVEQIPLAAITSIQPATEMVPDLKPSRGLWWQGCVVGRQEIIGAGMIEFFATTGPQGMVIISAGDQMIAISPPNLENFQQVFIDATRMGSLERIPTFSQRPDFIFAHLWADTVARVLILIGLALPLLLLGYLAVSVPELPPLLPFGYEPSGAPGLLAPPGRLLLLPMISGLCWLVDLVVGVWLYRRIENRPLALAMWAVAVVVGGLFLGAALQLLAAA